VGNRLSKAVQGGSTVTYSYDSVNRLVSATGMGFTWDDNGNLLTWDDGIDDWTYRYDPEDRLINVKKNGDLSAVYTYDADGRRVRSLNGDNVTDHVYSGLNVIDEVSGGAHKKHYYAGGIHIASNDGGTIEYYHQDHLGSTRLKTDSTGGVVYESNYEPYGLGSGESGSEEYRYTGKREDPTGLYYYGARYYDQKTGRFITKDPIPGILEIPQSLNDYVYAINNPLKHKDENGQCIGFIAAVVAVAIIAIDLYESHIAGLERQQEYAEEYHDAPDYAIEREYWIGSTKKMVGNVVEKIPVVKYFETTITEGVYEDRVVWPSQNIAGVPGYENEPEPYEGPELVHDVTKDFVHQTFRIPHVDDQKTVRGVIADKVLEELWGGVEMYNYKIIDWIFYGMKMPNSNTITFEPLP
jgi:RHS repeat-associated protein